MEGSPVLEVVESPLDAEDAIRADAPLPEALPVLPLRETVTFPDTLTPLAVGQERSIKLVNDVLGANRMLVMVASRDPENDEPGPERPLRGRRRRRRRPDDEGPRRDPAHPRPGDPAGPARPLRRRGALPGRADRRAARQGGRGEPRTRGADPQRPAHLLGDHRADPLPAGRAAAGGRQHRRPLGPLLPDRRRAADLRPRRSRSCSRRTTSPPACAASRRSSTASSRSSSSAPRSSPRSSPKSTKASASSSSASS